MDANDVSALRWENSLKRAEMVAEMERRQAAFDASPEAADAAIVRSKEYLRQLPATEIGLHTQPEQPQQPQQQDWSQWENWLAARLKSNNVTMANVVGDAIGEITDKLTKDMRDVLSAFENRITNIELRLDQLEAENRSSTSWFGRKAK